MRLTCILLFIFIYYNNINAQVVTFKKNYGYLYDDYGRYIQQTSDGGYILTGYMDDKPFGNYSGFKPQCKTIKIDSLGNTEWTKVFADTGTGIYYQASDIEGACVFQTNDNSYIVSGFKQSYYSPYNYGFLIKYDTEGDTLWSKCYQNIFNSYKILATKIFNDGYFLVGRTSLWDGLSMIKTDNDGDTLWTKIYKFDNNLYPETATQSPDSGYVITGSNTMGAFLFHINKNGDSLWYKTYTNSTGYAGGTDVHLTSDSCYIILGNTLGLPDYYYAIYIIKTNAAGDSLWTRAYGGQDISNMFEEHTVFQTKDDGYIITGGKYDTVYPPHYDAFLMKLDKNGDSLWSKVFHRQLFCSDLFDQYGGTNYEPSGEIAYCTQPTKDGGYILIGSKYIGSLGGFDIYVIKTDSMGNVYENTGIANDITDNEEDLKIYPNPSKDLATISFTTNETGLAKLEIFNYIGRYVYTLFNDNVNAGKQYNIELNTNNLSAGIYYCIMQTQNKRITKKIILVK